MIFNDDRGKSMIMIDNQRYLTKVVGEIFLWCKYPCFVKDISRNYLVIYIFVVQVIQVLQVLQLIQLIWVMQARLAYLWPDIRVIGFAEDTFRENALSTLLPPPCWWPEWSWRVHARANEGEVVIYERTVIHVEHKLSSRWSIVGDTARVSGPHGQIMVAVIFRFTNSL